MKNIFLKTILLSIFIFCSIIGMQAQVGIITTTPKSTLDVEEVGSDPNSADGIIAPLLTRSQLAGKDAQYGSGQTNALVYVTTIDGSATTKTAKVTQVGYYYFDGSIWQTLIDQPGLYFYLPSFILPTTTVGTGNTFDLYTNILKKQFSQSGNLAYNTSNSMLAQLPIVRFSANQFDYVVTYYDTDVIRINSISPLGIVNYDVLDTSIGPSSFINVVLITK